MPIVAPKELPMEATYIVGQHAGICKAEGRKMRKRNGHDDVLSVKIKWHVLNPAWPGRFHCGCGLHM